MVHLIWVFKNPVDLVLCIIRSDEKDIKLYVRDPFHWQSANKLSKLNQPVNINPRSSRILIKRTSADMKLSNYPKTLIFMFITTKQKQLVFIASEHKKQLLQLLKFLYFLHFELLASKFYKIKWCKREHEGCVL